MSTEKMLFEEQKEEELHEGPCKLRTGIIGFPRPLQMASPNPNTAKQVTPHPSTPPLHLKCYHSVACDWQTRALEAPRRVSLK